MDIAIINQSTLVTTDQVVQMVTAINQQVATDLCKAWNRAPVTIQVAEAVGDAPTYVYPITLVDTINDQPQGVLGYHTEEKGGKISGIVACAPELQNGGQVLTGDWSVSSVLSHEVCELIIDPNCQLWANDSKGRAYSFEVCDAVEGPTYVIDNVSVANFVFPSWFDSQAGRKPLDYLVSLKKPFEVLKTGYCVYEDVKGAHQVYGEEFPAWRKAMKFGPKARTQRRIKQAIQ